MRLTYMFSFILLFGAAGLVVFIHLQDPAELDRQQIPGDYTTMAPAEEEEVQLGEDMAEPQPTMSGGSTSNGDGTPTTHVQSEPEDHTPDVTDTEGWEDIKRQHPSHAPAPDENPPPELDPIVEELRTHTAAARRNAEGLRFNIGLQSPKKDCTSNDQDGKIMEKAADKLLKINQAGSPYPPLLLPTKFQSYDGRQANVIFLMKDNEKKGIETNPIRPHRQRKRVLIKKSPLLIAMNKSSVSFLRLKADERNRRWKRLYQIQRDRKKLMQDVCSKYKNNSRRIITPYHVSRIFVEDKHRILYCEVPKVGCSNWKRVLMILNGLASSAKNIQHNAVHYGNYLRRLDGFDRKGIYHRLNTYTKMLFIREPFERLVSAFRDKFEHANNYYHPVFGKPIISKYRRNATSEALRTGSGVQFKEFIQYLLDVHKPVGMDIHWDHVSRLCSPCLIDYDFIGKFESMEEDANFLLHLIGAPHNLTFPQFKDRHSNEERTSARITQQYFAQLSSSERQRTYDFYYMDYLMFNYSKPFEGLY